MSNGVLFTLGSLAFVTLSQIWGFTVTQTASMILIILSSLHFFTRVPGNLAWKGALYAAGTTQLVLSSEKKGMKKGIPDPDVVLKCDTKSVARKRIIFVRHGESVWNEMFNKGFLPPGFPFRVLRGVVREIFLLTSRDSVFYDSPLSAEGVTQAKDLATFIQNDSMSKGNVGDYVKIMRGEEGTSVLVSSNLRRAAATIYIGLFARLKKVGEKVHLLSTLQEMSRNVDTVAVSPPRKIARMPVLERRYGENGYKSKFECAAQAGNKSVFRRAYKDFLQFNEWVFTRKEDTIIVAGHSLWFKQYYKMFLPRDCDHDAKKFKMVNAGAIGFELTRGTTDNDNTHFRIDPGTMTTIYGGYKRK